MSKVERQSDDKIKKLIVNLEAMDNLSTQVGCLPGAKYKDGTSVAYIATIMEFGFGPIPPRSFMRTTMEEKKKAWANLAKSGNKLVLAGSMEPLNVMEGLGLQAAGDIKKKISEITSPPLAPATVKRKGSSKPLVESSLMLSSLTSSVVSK